MGKIKKLKDTELVGGTKQDDVYPITSTKAVFNGRNVPLDKTLARNLPINVSLEYSNSDIPDTLTLLQAIGKIPIGDRALGLNCRFLSSEGWKNYIYIGDTTELSDWGNSNNWMEYVNSNQLEEVRKETEESGIITRTVLDIKDSRTSTFTKIQGKYINNQGKIIENSSYTITEPIEIKKGESISFSARGLNIVAILSEVQGDIYTPLILGNAELTTMRYNYTANKDCFVVISSILSGLSENINIVKSGISDSQIALEEKTNELSNNIDTLGGSIDSLNNDLDTLKSSIDSLNNDLESLGYKKSSELIEPESSGQYIDYSTGNLVSFSGYIITRPINIKAGQSLQFNARCATTVAVLSIKNDNGTYTPLSSGSGVESNPVTFFANKDINNVVICALSSEAIKVDIITLLSYDLVLKFANLSGSNNIEYKGALQGYNIHSLTNILAGTRVAVKLKSDNKSTQLTVKIGNNRIIEGKSFIYTIETVLVNTPSLNVSIYSREESNVEYQIQLISPSEVKVSSYEDKIAELDNRRGPVINIPLNIQYKNIIIDSQGLYDTLTETIKQEISDGNTNLNVIFKNGVYKFNDSNVISLSDIIDPSVNLRFCCENASIISDGNQYNREDRVSIYGSRNVFNTSSAFNYKNTIVKDEEYIYPDINQGKGIFYFTDHITVVDSSNYIYKAPISNDADISNVIGKKVVFTAWWAGVFADITNAKEENGKKYLYFKISKGDASYIDSDLDYGVYPIVKILNFEDYSSNNSYYISDNKIYLPDADVIYECKYPQFMNIMRTTVGSIIFSNMNFIGSSNTGQPLINASGTSNIFVLDSSFKNIGHACLYNANSNGNNGNILVKGCKFYKCKNPLYLNGNNCSIVNNIFKKSGYYWISGYAIYIARGNNFYIGHNVIEDFTYSAIFISGGINVDQAGSNGIIEYNLVETVDWDSDYTEHQLIDSGAIQISIVNFPVIVRHNVISNYRTRKSGRGIMMGGNCSQVSIYKNLIVGTPSYSAIDYYKGTEKNTYYPNGVENLMMYNICESAINMTGGDDFINYPSYSKSDNDCTCGYNLIGDTGYNHSNQKPARTISNIPYFEEPIVDTLFSYKDSNHVTLSYNILPWKLSEFVLSRLQLSFK